MRKWIFWICFLLPQFVYAVELETAFIELNKKIRSSVVNISTIKEETKDMVQIFPGYFMPFNLPQLKGGGSGFIIDKKGLIITNFHVVQNFDKIQVQFARDEKFYPAKVLGSDSMIDIALLKVDVNKKLVPFKFGDSEKLKVGEWVAAIGNPHGYGHTMTKGIISAVKRELDDLNLYPLLQTDASINPGNSGGPLVNLKGEVIGVNQAIARGTINSPATGISFAIPINNVKGAIEDLKKYGFVRRGFIGVEFVNDGQKGALITNIVFGSPAQQAGLKIKDRIVDFSGSEIKTPKDLPKAVRKAKVGKKVVVTIVREGQKKQFSIVPKMLEKNSFSSIQLPAHEKLKIRGQNIYGGFRVAHSSAENLKHFNLPDMGARHPLVVYVKPDSPAFRGGLRAGDLLFQINGKIVAKTSQIREALKKGDNRLNILRYHQRYDKYLLISVGLHI